MRRTRGRCGPRVGVYHPARKTPSFEGGEDVNLSIASLIPGPPTAVGLSGLQQGVRAKAHGALGR